jgi:hypothetical protein
MSDLQISLVVIGAVVVGAVYLYNWLQERRYRRRLRQVFGHAPDDVLLRSGIESVHADGRLEPQLEGSPRPAPTSPEEGEHRLPVPAAASGPVAPRGAPAVSSFDTVLDYVVEIESDTPVADSVIGELTSKIAACGKPSRAAGFNTESGDWEDLARSAGARYARLKLALQLVNRSGPVNAAQLATFCDAVKGCADKIPARVTCPDTQAALKAARDLDAFCGDVDVAIGVNIIAEEDGAFSGTKIRGLAEAAGLKLEPDGVFHCRDERRHTLFTLDNHEPAPFLPEQIKSLSTRGITLLLDVPRVANGIAVLERMLEIARSFATAVGGRLVDDNRVALSDAGVSRIKEQLRSIHAAMEMRGIPAGGARALRLFS